jgi:hypothetical protein
MAGSIGITVNPLQTIEALFSDQKSGILEALSRPGDVLARKQEDIQLQRINERLAKVLPSEGEMRELMLAIEAKDFTKAGLIFNEIERGVVARGGTPADVEFLGERILPALVRKGGEISVDPTKGSQVTKDTALAELFGAERGLRQVQTKRAEAEAGIAGLGLEGLRRGDVGDVTRAALGFNPKAGTGVSSGGLTEAGLAGIGKSVVAAVQRLNKAKRGEGGMEVEAGGVTMRRGGTKLTDEQYQAEIESLNAIFGRYGFQVIDQGGQAVIRRGSERTPTAEGTSDVSVGRGEPVVPDPTSGFSLEEIAPEIAGTPAESAANKWLQSAQAGQTVSARGLAEALIEAGVPQDIAVGIAARIASAAQSAGL